MRPTSARLPLAPVAARSTSALRVTNAISVRSLSSRASIPTLARGGAQWLGGSSSSCARSCPSRRMRDYTRVKLMRMTITWWDAWVLCLTALRAPR